MYRILFLFFLGVISLGKAQESERIILPKEAIFLSKEKKISLIKGEEVSLPPRKEKWGYVTISEVRSKLTLEGVKEEKISYLFSYAVIFIFYFLFSIKFFSKEKNCNFFESMPLVSIFAFLFSVIFVTVKHAAAVELFPLMANSFCSFVISFAAKELKKNKTTFFIFFALVVQSIVSFLFKIPDFLAITIIAIFLGWLLGRWKKRKTIAIPFEVFV